VKAFLIVLCVAAALVAAAVTIAANNLAAALSYALTKSTGLSVSVEKAELAFGGGRAVLTAHNISVSGAIEGRAGEGRLTADLGMPLVLREAFLSDFAVTIDREGGDGEGRPPTFAVPVRLLKAERGRVAYGGRTYIVAEGAVQHLSGHGEFLFSGRIAEEGAQTHLAIEGKGFFRKKQFDVEGRYSLEDFALAALAPKYLAGRARAEGFFSYRNGRFSAEGRLAVHHFEAHAALLSRPVAMRRLEGNLALLLEKGRGVVTVSDVPFLGTVFSVRNRIEAGAFEGLDLTSGFFPTAELLERVKTDKALEGDRTLKDLFAGGEVKIRRLAYGPARPFSLELDVKDVAFADGKWMIEAIEGRLLFHGARLSVADGRARMGNSSFSALQGAMAMEGDKGLTLHGRYAVDLRDLPGLLPNTDMGDLTFLSGTTHGVLNLQEKAGEGISLSGTGSLSDGDLLFQKVRLSARGNYRFMDETLSFDPLTVERAGSQVIVRGTWNRNAADLALAGTLDMTDGEWPHLSFLKMNGRADIDVKLATVPGKARATGRIDLGGLDFEVPGTLRKAAGTPAMLEMAVTRTPGQAVFERLGYSMPSLDVAARGSFDGSSIPDLSLTVKSDDLRPVARLFLFDRDVEGRLSADLSVRDLRFPLTRLPVIDGSMAVENGFARLPGLRQPLEGIHLSARFDAGDATVHVSGLRCGTTEVATADLTVSDPEQPRFDLTLHFENFDGGDFQGTGPFSIPTIHPDSVLARTDGNMTVTARQARTGALTATDVALKGSFRESTLGLSTLSGAVMGGGADLEGHLDFTPPSPVLSVRGTISDASSGTFFRSIGSKTDFVAGPTTLSGFLTTKGRTAGELIGGLDGDVRVESSAGVIEKWSFLSKLFDLMTLNLNELSPGKFTVKAEGLTFYKIGATFLVSRGIFHTDDFVIDSPSMLITGSGDVDIGRRQIDGTLAVSPLTAIDTTIGRIPLLGTILRDEEKGIFYLTYRVKGPLDDPAISRGIATGLGGEAVGFLKRLLLAPFERRNR
jgi:hypothetical protein